jgi:DNA-binding SARP family transcriptional activator
MVIGDPDRPVSLGGPRQARLLAALLLHAGTSVPVSHLVEVLWDDRPPRQAVKVVRNTVSLLRTTAARAADPATITTVSGGYRLDVSGDELDLIAFHRLRDDAGQAATRGDQRLAAARLRAALALWRGPALHGLDCPALAPAVAHLDELYLACWERLADLELRLGRANELVGSLSELTRAHPLREHLHGRLMHALHYTGRRAEALATYRTLRDRLRDELGLDPDPAIQDLHRRILAGDPALAPSVEPPAEATPVPRQLPAAARHFTGRADELKALDDILDRPGGSTVVISAIDGTGGIGKTALALYWARQIADRYPDGQLYLNLRGYDPGHPPLEPARAIRSLLDTFAVEPARIPADPDGQAALYRSLVADKRLLVVLDNARDAAQVRPLLPGSPTSLVVVTSRNRLTGLIATEGADQLTLDLLSDAEARELLVRRLGPVRTGREPAALAELVELCGGLPLALNLAAAHAVSARDRPLAALVDRLRDAHQRLEALHTDDPAADLRAVFTCSYQALPAPAARMFRLLGTAAGTEISLAAAAALAGEPLDEARRQLAALTEGHLVEEACPQRYRMHDLIRAYAAERADAEVPPQVQRDAAARLLTWYLHTADAADRVLIPQRKRFALPAPPVTPPPLDFADQPDALGWAEQERANIVAAVDWAERLGLHELTWQLATASVGYFMTAKQWTSWIETHRTALRATRTLSDTDAEARILTSMGAAHGDSGAIEDSRRCLEEALELRRRLGDRAGQARTLLNLGHLHAATGDYAASAQCCEEALPVFQETGEAYGTGMAANNLGSVYRRLGRHDEAEPLLLTALDVFHTQRNTYGEAMTRTSLGELCQARGRHDEAAGHLEEALRLRVEAGDRHGEAYVLRCLGDIRHEQGRTADATGHWERALAIFDELRAPQAAEVRDRLGR